MKCSICGKPAIYRKGNVALCKEHFIEYFEKKVKDTIRNFNLIFKGDRVAVAVSGGKDSIALLHFLDKYKEEYGIEVIGIHINEGIQGYRDITTKHLLKIAKEKGWDVRVYTFKDYFGFTLDEAAKIEKKLKPCTICGTWRRWLLNKAAKDVNATKLATAHNLNDESQTIVMNLLDGNIKDLAKGGPYVGIASHEGFIPRIKPFYLVTEKEAMIYSLLNGINPPWTECKYIEGQLRDRIRAMLYNLEKKYPGIMENIVKTYLEILPELRKYFKEKNITVKKCKICGEPTSREICRACEIKLRLLKELDVDN